MAEKKSGTSKRITKRPGAKRATSPKAAAKTSTTKAATKVKLLSGGNPQIAKGYGDAPVQAYIAAIPGWKQKLARRIDQIVTRTIPNVFKAIKWNSPFYGFEQADGKGAWFLGFHCMTKYIKVAFFNGASLRPVPPGESKQKNVRYLDIHEHDELDEARLVDWVTQASELPLQKM
jgi:hypothetical protein